MITTRAPKIMAKRGPGRPRKVPEPESTDSAVATLDPEPEVNAESDIYSPDYPARKYWLLGVKFDEERGQIPFHACAFGGIGWQEGTQNQVRTEDGWLGLDAYRIRVSPMLLSSDQVRRAVSDIRQKVVRWQRRRQETLAGPVKRWRADVLSLEHRIKTRDKKKEEFVPAGYRYTPGVNDVPVSKYLVFIPRAMLQAKPGGGKLYEPSLDSMSSMFDLDPSLIPDRMSGDHAVSGVGDEAW